MIAFDILILISLIYSLVELYRYIKAKIEIKEITSALDRESIRNYKNFNLALIRTFKHRLVYQELLSNEDKIKLNDFIDNNKKYSLNDKSLFLKELDNKIYNQLKTGE